MATTVPVTLDTLITIKISIQGSNRKFKVPMRDLGAHVLPLKLRLLLSIPPGQQVVFERFSDSAGAYITLDTDNPTVYKTLFRAAKAKLKLRLRATIVDDQDTQQTGQGAAQQSSRSAVAPTAPPALNLPYRTYPLPVDARSASLAEGSPSTTGTIPLYPYARLPAFHSTNMRTMTKPAEPAAPALIQVADGAGEAPVPRAFAAQKTNTPRDGHDVCKKEASTDAPANCAWSVYCNTCDKPMANEHYHCSICDGGDYDLCGACVEAGHHCPGEGHWLIKRFFQSGKVINSTTERVAPKVRPEAAKEMPGSFTEEKKVESDAFDLPSRTCNSCIRILPEVELVTCKQCEDYDLCIPCVAGAKHGHHPGHAFEPVSTKSKLDLATARQIHPGRAARHHAICDGCDNNIFGIRYKCTDCPDWDFCFDCIGDAKNTHPMHRFVPVYDPLIGTARNYACRHFGIYCDGPLCKDKMNQSYIEGIRYKCAVCHDTDFCANCESHPNNRHNRTHPVIKFKTPVKNVSVTTTGEDKHGAPMVSMGDRDHPPRKSASTETVSMAPYNYATQVQTIADLKPSDDGNAKPVKEKIQIKDLLAEPIEESANVDGLVLSPVMLSPKPVEPAKRQGPAAPSELNAHFIRDTISDGTKIATGQRFIQSWTLRNPGPHAWPAGCSVRYVGGDNMLNVDSNRPSSAATIADATESNVFGREISVGEEVCFTVRMKAPSREGTSICYWRLKTADGTPFGHRLWCHIEVQSPSPKHDCARDYSRSMHRLQFEQQDNKREHQPAQSLTLADYERKLLMLEQDNKREYQTAQARTLADYERQMLVLEKDNKREHQTAQSCTLADYERQLLMLEQDNKRCLLSKMRQATECSQEPKENSSSHESQMVFPVLEKESPVSSTHEAVTDAPTVAGSPAAPKAETVVSGVSDGETLEFFEDAESVELDASSEDNGVLTDEEYDVLDASDEFGG